MEMDARALADIEKANEIIRSPAGGITGKG
jgi:hypothetical protein